MVGGIHESALRAGGFRQRVVRPDSKQIFLTVFGSIRQNGCLHYFAA
jgi:hypothetical protein